MEETTKREQLSLIKELTQGKELATQLCNHLLCSSSTHETNESLIEKILSSYDKALKMLYGENVGEANNTIGRMLDSHCSTANRRPRSEVLDQEDKYREVFKKRKTMPRWTEQVKVCSVTGLEGCLDDGYSWRKYGQKDILGAKFPRGYYRCTHRHAQGCLATKQVQRSDEDSTIYEVTYRGRHSCTQSSYLSKVATPKIKMGLGENHFHCHENNQPNEENMEQSLETMFDFGAELEVKMEDIFPSFCFPSPLNEANNVFPETMMENHFMENFSPAFISPATSESNILCLSPCHLSGAGLGQKVQASESEITEIVSAPTSVINSPLDGLDILLEQKDFHELDFQLL